MVNGVVNSDVVVVGVLVVGVEGGVVVVGVVVVGVVIGVAVGG